MMSKKNKIFALAAATAFGGLAATANAAAIYKINNATNLNDTASWSTTSGSQTPNPSSIGSTDALYFNEVTMQGSKTVSLGGDLTVGGLALDYATSDTANNLTINAGNTLTLMGTSLGGSGVAGTNYTAAGIVLNRGTGGTLTINSAVALGATQQWVSGRSSGGFTVAGNVNLGGYTLTTFINAGTTTISGAISGTGALTKTGNGVLVLSGSNSNSGGVTLGTGAAATSNVLELGNANALGTGVLHFRGGLLRAGTAGLTLSNNMDVGTGGVRMGGTNSFTLSGTLTMDASSRTVANYSSNGSTITIGGITTIASSVVAFDNAANGATGAPIIISGAITGVGGVALSGNHNTTLAGVNTYTGTTTLSGGTLTLSGSTAAGSAFTMSGGNITGTGTVNGTMAISGGTIRLAGGATTTSLTFNQGVTFTNSPTVVFANTTTPLTAYDVFGYGTGTVTGIANLKIGYRGTLTDDTVNKKYVFTTGEYGATRTWNTTTGTWDAYTTANFLEGDQKFATGDNVIFGDIASDSVVTISGTLTPGSVTVSNSANKYTFQTGSITGTGSLVKSGSGTLQISSNQSYTGGTTVNGGKLILAGGGSSGTIRGTLTANAGTVIEIGGSDVFGYSTGTDSLKTIYLNGATLNQAQNRNETSTAAINMSGGASITATGGTGALFDMFGGSAAINSTGDTTNTISSPLRLRQNDTTFTVADGAAATDLQISGVISKGGEGNGAIIKAGAGRLVLSGSNTYTGNTTITGGTLDLSGSGSIYNGATKSGASSLAVNGGGVLAADRWSWGNGQSLGQLNYNSGNIAVDNGTIRNTASSSTAFNNRGVAVGAGGITYENATAGTTWTITGGANTNSYANNATVTLTGAGNGSFEQAITGTGVSVVKNGAGLWAITSSNTYTGTTTVNTGTLAVNGSLDASSAVSLASGATLMGAGTVGGTVTVANGGTITAGNGTTGSLTVGNLTFGSTTGDTATINVLNVNNYLSSAALITNGTLTLNGGTGAITINMGSTTATQNTIHLIANSAFTPSSDITGYALGTTPTMSGRQSGGTLQASAGYLDYVISGLNPYWTGALSSEWSTATLADPKNWATSPTVTTDYMAGDLVTFDDTATGTTTVSIASDVSPASVTFNNSTLDYSLTGAAGIAGATSLIKSGTGTLTISSSNSYTGGTTINAGTLAVADVNSLGASSGALTFAGNGTLLLNSGFTSSRNYVINNGVTATINTNGNVFTQSGTVSGAGVLAKAGSGTLVLSASNSYSGGTTINAGTLAVAAVNNLGTGTLTFTGAGTLQTNATLANSRAIVVNSGVTGATIALGSYNFTQSAGINTNGGTLTKSGAGTLILSGNTISGGGVIDIAAGQVNTSGTVALGTTNLKLEDACNMVITYGSVTTGGSITLGAGSQLGIQNGGGGNYNITSNIVLASGSGTANAASIGGFIYGNGTNLTGTISGSGDLRWRTNILGGGSNSATYSAANNTSGWAANSYTGATSFEGVNLNFTLASNTNDSTVTPFGASTNTATISSGTLTFTQTGAAGNRTNIANPITLAGGTVISTDGDLHFTGNVTVSGAAMLVRNWGINTEKYPTKALQFDGVVSGSSALTLRTGNTTANSETGVTIFNNAGNTYSGTLTVDNVTNAANGTALVLGNNTAMQYATINLNGNSTTTQAGVKDRSIIFASGVTAPVIAGLTGSGNVTLTDSAGTPAAVALTVNTTASNSYTGVLSGAGSLVKTGSGTLTLSGSNTYSGGTTVNAGMLVAGHASAFGAGAITVSGGSLDLNGHVIGNNVTLAGGTLSNSAGTGIQVNDLALGTAGSVNTSGQPLVVAGTLSGAGNITASTVTLGNLAPGNSPGLVTITGDATLVDGSYSWQILDATGAAGTGYDSTTVSGLLDLSSVTAGGYTINVQSLTGISPDVQGTATNFVSSQSYSWTLFDYGTVNGFDASKFTVNPANFVGADPSATWTVTNDSTSGAILLNYVVPEPGTLGLLALGALALLGRRRNRK